MKVGFYIVLMSAALLIAVLLIKQTAQAQEASGQPGSQTGAMTAGAGETAINSAAAIDVTEIPAGYRDWRLISVAHEGGKLNDIRAILGNDIAIQACRDGTIPFPDGTIIARLAWDYVPSDENNRLFDQPQSFVAGAPKNGVQFMVKDSKKYAATGGWGFGQFDDGKPVNPAMLSNCFPCHEHIKARDDIFTRYSP